MNNIWEDGSSLSFSLMAYSNKLLYCVNQKTSVRFQSVQLAVEELLFCFTEYSLKAPRCG